MIHMDDKFGLFHGMMHKEHIHMIFQGLGALL